MATTAQKPAHRFEWYGSGHSYLDAMLQAIASARACVRLEIYAFGDTPIGRRFRDALADAAKRGLRVELLTDGFGSRNLPKGFFASFTRAGGTHRHFNNPHLGRWALRDHRKLLLVDESLAFVGGCNISEEYYGDGVTQGWRDGGICVSGPVLGCLEDEFSRQWKRSKLRQWELMPGSHGKRFGSSDDVLALFMKPGFGGSPMRAALRVDLKTAQNIAITAAYFLPTRRLRQQLSSAAKRGARVRVLLAGKSDVKLMALASRSLYRGLLRSNIEVYEYQPQTLHAKLMVLDDIVYIGSSNLDPRSLRINFEIMLRVNSAGLAEKALAQFEADLTHSRRITNKMMSVHRSWWMRIKQRVAFYLLAKLDPWIAREHLRRFFPKK
jgi:cardiolipin synthase